MTTRRTFIQQAGILSGALLLNSCSILPAQEKSKVLGIQLYTLRNQLSSGLNEVMKRIAEAGYKDVETFGYDKEKYFFGVKPEEFKKMLNDNGLKSTCGHYNANDYMGSSSDDEMKLSIDAAKRLNQEVVIVPWLLPALRSSEDGYKKIADKLNHAAELCKDAGLQLAYHNHDFEFEQFGNTTGYDILLNNTDAEMVKMELDLYWIIRAGKDPIDYFNKYPGRFISFHIKDMGKVDKTLNTDIGDGSIDFKRILSQAKKAGTKYYFVEYDVLPVGKDPYVSITNSSKYVLNNLM
ncbi:MAG: sugar phosphate isomerase/epimerase [Daejeonella sp.]